MTPPIVVCHGRPVDGRGQPVGERCTARFRPPQRTAGGWRIAHPLSAVWRPPTPAEVVQMAIAGGWVVAPDDHPDHTGQELVGMCPSCRRPAPVVTALVREVARRG